jgi:4-hydroxy-2-oxoglutarate aldolase
MSRLDLAGIFPPIPTPFDVEGSLSDSALKQNLEYLNGYELSGIVVLGSNGEFVFLDPEEKIRATKIVRELLPSGKLLFAGTGCESTRSTVRLTREAASAGADAALVINPHYYKNRLDRAALVRYYTSVADQSPVPIILYNMPACTGLDLDASIVVELAGHENIIGMKDSSGNLTKMAQILEETKRNRRDFQMLAGSAGFLLPALSVGAVGGVAALANVAPDLCIRLHRTFLRGELQKAAELQGRIVELNNLVTRVGGVPALKAALDLLGLAGGAPRPPLLPADTPMRERLQRALSELGLLDG